MTFIVVKAQSPNVWFVVAVFEPSSEGSPNMIYAELAEYKQAERVANALNGTA